MGQKTNANIFRLGLKNNEWKCKYFEKNYSELTLYSYQDLEIRKYLKQFFKLNGLTLHNYKLYYSKTTLYLFISYYITLKSLVLINKINFNQNIKLLKKKRKKKNKHNKKSSKTRLKLIKYYKKNINIHKYNNKKKFKINYFTEKLLESLSFFLKKKINIFITFQNLNKGLSLKLKKFQIKSLKKVLLKLRQNFNYNFFKETINILLIAINKKKSAKLLSEYIAYQLNKLTKNKRHRFFLIFLKRTLIILSKTNFYKIDGIKIIVKGKFNGIPRAKKNILLIGKVPLQNLNSKIDYYQSTSFTQNGTFGIQTWICENIK